VTKKVQPQAFFEFLALPYIDDKRTHRLSIGHQTFILQPIKSSISRPPAFDVHCGGKITSDQIIKVARAAVH
jgi:hypothetical protein